MHVYKDSKQMYIFGVSRAHHSQPHVHLLLDGDDGELEILVHQLLPCTSAQSCAFMLSLHCGTVWHWHVKAQA